MIKTNNKKIMIVLIVIAVGALAFYAGRLTLKGRVNAQNYTGTRTIRGATAGNFRARAQGGFISGEILSKDDKSVTVKLPEGGSKIIFYSQSTLINKSVVGNSDDLEAGKQISVMGSANADGSVSASSIDLRNMPVNSRSGMNPTPTAQQ